tara:strand:- start:185 stop:361 length:177 start_codon:yes stop_codon:yes gene_type:complete
MENFKHILKIDYNNRVDESAEIIDSWMRANSKNAYVQNLGNIWLKKLIRSERERILPR